MARTLFDYGAITDLPGATSSADITLEGFVRDRFVFGTPAECVETIERFRDEVGVDDFLMIFRYPTGPDHASVLEAMELFGTEVLPALEPSRVPRVRPLRIGVVGLNYAAGTHLPVYAALAAEGLVELAAVATAHRATADAAARTHGVERAHVGFEALCADPDVDLVDVATRPSRHAAMVEAALGAGKHVLCEAPLALSVAEGEALAEAATRAGTTAVVDMQSRFWPGVAELRRLVLDGYVGRVDNVAVSAFYPTFTTAAAIRASSWCATPHTGPARCACTACTPRTCCAGCSASSTARTAWSPGARPPGPDRTARCRPTASTRPPGSRDCPVAASARCTVPGSPVGERGGAWWCTAPRARCTRRRPVTPATSRSASPAAGSTIRPWSSCRRPGRPPSPSSAWCARSPGISRAGSPGPTSRPSPWRRGPPRGRGGRGRTSLTSVS